jgi:hypothetical protein
MESLFILTILIILLLFFDNIFNIKCSYLYENWGKWR